MRQRRDGVVEGAAADHTNPHSVLRGKELTDLIEIVKCSDWDRRRAEYVDRALFTVVDGYDRRR